MRASRYSKKSSNLQQSSKSIAQLLLSSLKVKKSQTSSEVQQIDQLLTLLNTSQKVMITPMYKKVVREKEKQKNSFQYIEIYNIRDNQIKFKRRPARKISNKNNQRNRMILNASDHGNQPMLNDKMNELRHDKLMFSIEQSLCLNCLVYSMTQSQNIHLSFGIKREDFLVDNDESLQNKSEITMIDDKILKPIRLSPQVQKKLVNNYNGLSPFCSLKSFVIQVYQQTLTFEQWLLSMKIVGQLIKFIQNQSLISLERLQINIYDQKKYCQSGGNAFIDDLLKRIYSGLYKIINSKNSSSNSQMNQNHFPKLTQLSFNPTLYLRTYLRSQPQYQYSKQKFQTNNQISSIEKLTLIQLPPSVNTQSQLMKLLNQIFPLFPKIIHLTLQMSRSYSQNQFKLFNFLCSELYKFCPYLQFLTIINNDQRQDKQAGLRAILQFYPYLSDLKIKLCPKILEEQNQKQWIYMNQILWRRLHIQRLINLVKILESRGYQTNQCMGVMEFMRPLKFPLNIVSNNR